MIRWQAVEGGVKVQRVHVDVRHCRWCGWRDRSRLEGRDAEWDEAEVALEAEVVHVTAASRTVAGGFCEP